MGLDIDPISAVEIVVRAEAALHPESG